MKKIIYTKCSVERKKQYQIITSIVEKDGKRVVEKKAANLAARSHIKHIEEISKNTEKYEKLNLHLAECKLLDDKTIELEYIEGDRFDSLVRKHILDKNFERVLDDITLLKKIIYGEPGKQEFMETSEFREIFGTWSLGDGYEAATGANIDMVLSNLILNERINVIDYEWTFDFPIPLKYIFFRSIYLSGILDLLVDEEKQKVRDLLDVSYAEEKEFWIMEQKFQAYVTGVSLTELYRDMPIRNYIVLERDLERTQMQTLVLDAVDASKIYFEKIYMNKKNRIEVCVEESEIIWQPIKTNGIIKINKVEDSLTGQQLPISTNADLVIIDDYYFENEPQVKIQTQNSRKVTIDWEIIVKDSELIGSHITALKREKEQADKVMLLERQVNNLKTDVMVLEKCRAIFEKLRNKIRGIVKKGN